MTASILTEYGRSRFLKPGYRPIGALIAVGDGVVRAVPVQTGHGPDEALAILGKDMVEEAPAGIPHRAFAQPKDGATGLAPAYHVGGDIPFKGKHAANGHGAGQLLLSLAPLLFVQLVAGYVSDGSDIAGGASLIVAQRQGFSKHPDGLSRSRAEAVFKAERPVLGDAVPPLREYLLTIFRMQKIRSYVATATKSGL